MGRRISKMMMTTNDDPAEYGTRFGPPITWSIDRCVRYVWDGWHLSLSYRVQGNGAYLGPDQSFAWGPDLSSSYGGAGGIGGLVAYCDDDFDTNNPSNDPDLGPMYPIYDGNGNVVRMCRFAAVSGGGSGGWGVECRTAAAYEYGPFGEALSVTGEDLGPSGGGGQGQRNPFRFSTKYTDAETGLVYYGYRYYSPSMGRWVSRDPIEEADGPNILRFAENDPCNLIDPVGLSARAWLTRQIKLAAERSLHSGLYRAEAKKQWGTLGAFEIQFKYGIIGTGKTKELSLECNKCVSISAYAAIVGQFKSLPIALLLGGRFVVEPTFAASGRLECCIDSVGGAGEFRVGALYCRGDINVDLGVKLGIRWGVEIGKTAQAYVEGGGYLGGQYSFRRDEWRVAGYVYVTGVYEWEVLGWKRSRRFEYRRGSNVDF